MSETTRFFPPMTRRHWMGHLASTALGIPAIQFFASLDAAAQQLRKTNRSCIVLWMGGGPSHLDIWDLKPDSEKNGGPFKPIATSAPGVKITEHLPKVAKQMHHLSVIRSLDSKEGNHDRGTYMMHTGYTPNPTVVHPGFGSYCAVELGERLQKFDLPHCIAINSPSVGAGFLGMSYAPFVVQNPNAPIANLKPPRDVEEWRMERRLHMLGQVENQFAVTRASQAAIDHKSVYEKTLRMMNSQHQDTLQPRARAGRGARFLRPRLVRLGLPDGQAAGRAGRELRRSFARRLGYPHQQFRRTIEAAAARAGQGDVGPGRRSGPAPPARYHDDRLDGRIRPHAPDQSERGPRPLAAKLVGCGRRRRHQRRPDVSEPPTKTASTSWTIRWA